MNRLLSAILLCVILTIPSTSQKKKWRNYTHSTREQVCSVINGEWKSVKNKTELTILPTVSNDSCIIRIKTNADEMDDILRMCRLDSINVPENRDPVSWYLLFDTNHGLYYAMIVKLTKDTLQLYDKEQKLNGTYLWGGAWKH